MKERPLEVLVVDDGNLRVPIATALEARHCIVRFASTAEEALFAIGEHVPDVLMSDLALADGAAACVLAERLQREPHTRSIARIAIMPPIRDRKELLPGFDAYVSKPLDTNLLFDLARRLTVAHREQRRSRAAG